MINMKMFFFQVDKEDSLASIQEDKESPRREARLNYQEKSSEAFYPSFSPPTKAFYPSSPNEEEEEEEMVFPSILGSILKKSQNSREKSLLSTSSSDLSSSSCRDEEEEELGFLVERGDRSPPESISDREGVRERRRKTLYLCLFILALHSFGEIFILDSGEGKFSSGWQGT